MSLWYDTIIIVWICLWSRFLFVVYHETPTWNIIYRRIGIYWRIRILETCKNLNPEMAKCKKIYNLEKKKLLNSILLNNIWKVTAITNINCFEVTCFLLLIWLSYSKGPNGGWYPILALDPLPKHPSISRVTLLRPNG